MAYRICQPQHRSTPLSYPQKWNKNQQCLKIDAEEIVHVMHFMGFFNLCFSYVIVLINWVKNMLAMMVGCQDQLPWQVEQKATRQQKMELGAEEAPANWTISCWSLKSLEQSLGRAATVEGSGCTGRWKQVRCTPVKLYFHGCFLCTHHNLHLHLRCCCKCSKGWVGHRKLKSSIDRASL